ncbi:PucR family transcriptional regulator [Caldalkalibacillus salinus]|uniref:PucR family transcriptional regulator n=1 Tax=Caldalkalibacillus salinus TaxID=2803787 RepID=UPI001920A1B2|nr:helix-turn-helix domain-containing protein [Caldalkalibacillus salinus]
MLNIKKTWMYAQMKRIYGENHLQLVDSDDDIVHVDGDYHYIQVKEGLEEVGWIGIKKARLSEDAEALLHALSDIASSTLHKDWNTEQSFWMTVIQHEPSYWLEEWRTFDRWHDHLFGLVYIILPEAQIEEDGPLEDWVKGVIEDESYLLRIESDTFVWIIPSFESVQDNIQQIVQNLLGTVMSEMMVDPKMTIGEPFTMPSHVHTQVKQELRFLRHSLPFSWGTSVVHMRDLLTYALLGHLREEDAGYAVEQVLRDTRKDQDLLHTIQVFLQENLNISEAAKQLFIHRNSMQYRLDKFTEKTGMDIRKFEDAVKVHLAIQALGKLNKK